MIRLLWAVVFLGAGARLCPAADAATVASARVLSRGGVTGPAARVTVNMGGPSLPSGVGPAAIKGFLSDLPGVPTAKGIDPAAVRSGVVESAPDVALPGLPASAIPGAEASQAVGTFAVETMADFRLSRPETARQDFPDGILHPGPGGGLPAFRRQALRLAAKAEAVKAQLSAASEVQSLTAEEGTQGVGRRLMDILTDERSLDGSRGARSAVGVRSDHAGFWVTAADAEARPLAAGLRSGAGRTMPSAGWVSEVPATRGGYRPVYRQAFSPGPAADSFEPGVGGVALIALRVSRQSLVLSVVDAPARGLALRLATDSAQSLVGQVSSGPGQTMATVDLRDAVAASIFVEPGSAVPLGSQVQSAQSEVFSFLQSTGGDSADQVLPDAPTGASYRSGSFLQRPGHAPVSVPDPRLACALLPFLGLLILRSRLFS